ncbi:Flocculation suppression protein, partial [Exophiala xenobiotica]
MTILPQNNNTSPKSSHEDSMQISSPAPPNMGPPTQGTSPELDPGNTANGNRDPTGVSPTAAAVGASQGPKVVQTAFIHKLYSMLEDKTIQHLISWSNTQESFVMSPSNEFSKVLAQYFKHTNISSFVRQLNMYGFHKVSDVFHTGSPESALWEFKHGNGSFKKGDLTGLREIKRRASRHTLIHRDSFSNPKSGVSQPGTPAEIMPDTDQRLAGLEQAFYDMLSRLQRTEENNALMSSRCQALTEGM